MKVVLFCGGLGTRLREHSDTIPKPLASVRIFCARSPVDLTAARAQTLGNNVARWFTALPPNVLTMAAYRKSIVELARARGITARHFGERELTHMRDVRRLFGAALRLQLVVLGALAVLALALARTRLRTVVPTGLLAGALATLGVAALAVPVIVLGFDGFFTRFHEVFFSGDSWRFSTADTLIRLYPERFWEDVSRLAAAIAVGQAIVLAPLAWWWRRAAQRRAA